MKWLRRKPRRAMTDPVFDHDCDGCTYLGFTFHPSKGVADLYWCPQGGIPTVIARFSDDGGDYHSGLSAADNDVYLHEARLRAEDRGLL